MSTTRVLQHVVTAWHNKNLPDAPSAALGLKLCEEAGELAKAINRMEHTKHPDPVNLRDEIGDVAIVLLALCSRYGLNFEENLERRVGEIVERPLRADAV